MKENSKIHKWNKSNRSIKEVFDHNFVEEISKISHYVETYNFISMVLLKFITKFP
jgi:hypothetical protein